MFHESLAVSPPPFHDDPTIPIFNVPSWQQSGVWSYGLALVASLAFGWYLLQGAREAQQGRHLIAAILLGAPAALAAIAFMVLGREVWWSAWRGLDASRIAVWLAFLAALTAPLVAKAKVAGVGRRAIPWAWMIAGLAGGLFAFGALLPIGAPSGDQTGLTFSSQFAFAALLGGTVLGLILIETLYRNGSEEARWRIKPLLFGIGGALAFDVFLYADALLFGAIDYTLWAARGVVQVVVMPFVAIATARNRDWTIKIGVSRGIVFHSTAMLGAGLYLLVMSAAGYYVQMFGGSWAKLLQVALVFAAILSFAFLVVSGSARARLRVFVNKNFFSYRYDYRQEWLRVTTLLATRDDSARWNERAIRALADLVESQGGALWLRREPTGTFRQVARWNADLMEVVERAGMPLATFLAGRAWVVELDEWRAQPALYGGLEVPEWLAQDRNAWLVVPLISLDELIGFVVLIRPRTAIDVNWEVRDLLKTAGRQVASYLAQIQSAEALLEAGKFEAFSRMSAFVVHDIKNLVAQLSLLDKNAERHRSNPEFQEDMLLTVRHVGDRLNGLLTQLRAGTAPVANPAAVELTPVVRRVQTVRAAKSPPVELGEAAAVVVLGHGDRLERVIGHLVQNAQDATKDGSPVRLRIESDGDHAVVEIIDRGVGMSADFVRHQLFRPFQTTKANGMGIGAYESLQYVRELGGRIDVDSTEGVGTRVRVYLPLAASREVTTHHAEAA